MRLKKILQDPLLHFVVLGGLLSWVGRSPETQTVTTDVLIESPNEIQVSQTIAEKLWKAHREITGRDLTNQERADVIENHIQEELLIREAYRLGLDQNDARIRQRLADKMRFLYVGPIPDRSQFIASSSVLLFL